MQQFEITDIRKTKKGRFSIFIAGEYAFSVDDETLLKNKLSVGKFIDVKQLKSISFQKEFNKALNKAYSILSFRQHSCYEIKLKLSKFYEEDVIDVVVDKLVNLGLLNDEEFTKLYLQQNIKKAKFSLMKIKYDLRKKGISQDLIEDCISSINNVDDANSVKLLVLKKYRKSLAENDVQKIKMSLSRRGFKFDDINVGINRAFEELYEN